MFINNRTMNNNKESSFLLRLLKI